MEIQFVSRESIINHILDRILEGTEDEELMDLLKDLSS